VAADVRAAAFSFLAQVASYDDALAGAVADAGAIEPTVRAVADVIAITRSASITLLLELAKKNPTLAGRLVAAGAAGALTRFLQLERGREAAWQHGALGAGYLAQFSAALAHAQVDAGVHTEVVGCLGGAATAAGAGAAAWAIEQMGQFAEPTAEALVAAGAARELLAAHGRHGGHDPTRRKIKGAFKALMSHCGDASALVAFVGPTAPPELLIKLLNRMAVLLAASPAARQLYVTSGALMRTQEVLAAPPPVRQAPGDEALRRRIADVGAQINSLFPGPVVGYYAPKAQ